MNPFLHGGTSHATMRGGPPASCNAIQTHTPMVMASSGSVCVSSSHTPAAMVCIVYLKEFHHSSCCTTYSLGGSLGRLFLKEKRQDFQPSWFRRWKSTYCFLLPYKGKLISLLSMWNGSISGRLFPIKTRLFWEGLAPFDFPGPLHRKGTDRLTNFTVFCTYPVPPAQGRRSNLRSPQAKPSR